MHTKKGGFYENRFPDRNSTRICKRCHGNATPYREKSDEKSF